MRPFVQSAKHSLAVLTVMLLAAVVFPLTSAVQDVSATAPPPCYSVRTDGPHKTEGNTVIRAHGYTFCSNVPGVSEVNVSTLLRKGNGSVVGSNNVTAWAPNASAKSTVTISCVAGSYYATSNHYAVYNGTRYTWATQNTNGIVSISGCA